MAWQLIYTSAPRLLEAGRSGFGTVARHRAIPGLLAGAVERVSQFSRLPGLAEERIIYSHRHISAGGVRYHIISRICDAGADYTGRTNHIAHHLIVDAREAAAAGISPADVMLSFAWKSRWDEAPRYLEAGEEISLAAIPPVIRLPARWWERMAGNARYAALLAAPEVSRGCYLVYPGDTQRDAQQQTAVLLFGECLLLAAGRTWSIPFTTNLQPSDESGDFLWSGVWATSPVRNQAEQSERVIFYLEPGGAIRKGSQDAVTLPKGPAADLAATGQSAEAPKVAAIPSPIENSQPAAGKPFLPKTHESARMPALPSSYAAGKTPFPTMPPPPLRTKFPWALVAVLTSAVMLLSGVGFFIGKKMQGRREMAATIEKELKSVPGHKDSDTALLLQQMSNGRPQEDIRNIAATAQDLALKWVKALTTTTGNKDMDIRQDVESLQGDNITQPESIPAFVKQVQDWLDLREKVLQGGITDEKSYDDYASLCSDSLMQNGEADSIPVRNALLQKNADTRARYLLDSLNTKHKQGPAWFREKLDAIRKDVPEITDSVLEENVETLDKIITLWAALEKSIENNQPSDALAKDHFHESPLAPAWLVAAVNDLLKPKVNAIAGVVTPSPAPDEIHGLSTSTVITKDEDKVKDGSKSIYIAVGDDGLAGLALLFDPRNLSKLTLFINNGSSVDLAPFTSGNKTYFKKEKFWFQASAAKLEHISNPFGDKEQQPAPPYMLKGSANEDPQGGRMEFEINVISTSNLPAAPLLQFQGGLALVKQDKTSLITYDKGFKKLAANLVFPPNAKLKTPANFNPAGDTPLTLDFSKYQADISVLMNDLMDKKKDLESQVAASKPAAGTSSQDPVKNPKDEIKNLLLELSNKLKTESLKSKLPTADQPPEEIIRVLLNLTRVAPDLRGDTERNAFKEDVKRLTEAIDSIQKLNIPSPSSATAVFDSVAQQRNQNELDALKKSPLLDGKLPGGSYSIVVGDAGHETILAEFIIPAPEEKHP